MDQQNGSNSKQVLTPNGTAKPAKKAPPSFDRTVILQQSPNWSRGIAWVLMGVTASVLIWASVAQIEEAVPAAGKLEPTGAVKEIQAPVGGVVSGILVEDGQKVKKGDLLLTLDPTVAEAQQSSSNKIRNALTQENAYYRSQMGGSGSLAMAEQEARRLKLPPELVSLTKSRVALNAENRLYRAQLAGSSKGSDFTPEQQAFLQSSQAESNSRVASAESEVSQAQSQLIQNRGQLNSARDVLKMNQKILTDLEPLVEQGGISRVQYVRQQQEVRTRQAEVDRLTDEQQRLQFALAGAKEKRTNTTALSTKDLLTKISDNEKRLAEIDSQLTKAIVENDKRIAEIDSQLSQAQLTLRYQELRAPVDGTVFDLKAHTPGFVTNSSEPVLKIVPADALTAKVYITNRDIGFVHEGMDADVRIDSFPFSEFGDVKGKLVWIGSDALPPDQIRNFYSFPAKVQLEKQSLSINGRDVSLQSGMSVSANIRLRKRTVLSIFTDLFSRQTDSFKFVR
ncbi:HlyD family efflux transporter periplasmic adaptor subunit [Leptolyngbya sp. FACHB-261]|nr:HlyD family efflux transporter periplasmic adaptor subunit [Leptolyngbya sp. FACHB-261]